MRKCGVVVIARASAGVGRALAREFARNGAKAGLIARDRERLEKTKDEVESLGGAGAIAMANVADPDQVELAAEMIEQELGPINIWINNAMVSVFSPVSELQVDELRRVTEVTYLGAAYGTMAALRRMRRRNTGTIVQVGSALAYRSIPLQAAYCAAKHAIIGFTASLRTELLHDKSNVRLTMVHLPAVNTPQFSWVKSRLPKKAQPVPPIFQPEVIAKGIYWAAHQNRRVVFIGGPTLKAIWGNKIAPDFADHYLANNGFSAQQTNIPEDPDRPDNLWEPVPGDFGAHGEFDIQAKNYSFQLWFTKHRVALGIATAVASLIGFRIRKHLSQPERRIESIRRAA